MPLCAPEKKLPAQDGTENEFLASAANLCQVHGLPFPDFKAYGYPYNVLLMHRDLKMKLKRQPYPTELLISEGKGERIVLSTKQVFEVGSDLFYIPVIPLYRYLRKKENNRSGALLLAVMCYLYREAGIPYYRDEGSFMFDEYEMNREYFLECKEENPDEYEEDISDILRNDICGDIMQRKVLNPYHLIHWEANIAKFKPQNALDEECLLVAQEAIQLSRDFPNANVFQHISPPEGGDEPEEIAVSDAYVAFIGDYKGWVYENIERSVNDYLGNFSQIAVPSCVQEFDGTEDKVKNLEFEYRLINLLESLCAILFKLP